MECEESLTLLSDFRDGVLDGTVQVEIRAHLRLCEPCMDVFVELDMIVSAASGLKADEHIPFPDEDVLWQRMEISERPIQ
jgi:hypothetical protein